MVIEKENENYPDYFEVSEKELELIGKVRQEVIKYRDNTNILGDITEINEDYILVKYFPDENQLEDKKKTFIDFITINRKTLTWEM